jgi:hypothetical protein
MVTITEPQVEPTDELLFELVSSATKADLFLLVKRLREEKLCAYKQRDQAEKLRKDALMTLEAMKKMTNPSASELLALYHKTLMEEIETSIRYS